MSSSDTRLPAMASSHPEEGKPWWKFPLVWMVVGGPLAVVIACVITWFVIMRAPDQVLTQTQDVENKALTQQGAHYAPAQRARNHAATGGEPADN